VVARVLPITKLNNLSPQGATWREQGISLAIAAGGDGVIGGVITHLAGSGIPLAILPLGTSNDIARSLAIPQNLSEAVKVVAQGQIQPIDIGVAQSIGQTPPQSEQEPRLAPAMSQACFAHALTVGLNVQFARIATNIATRQRFGKLAYPVAALQTMRTQQAQEVELHFEGLAGRSLSSPSQASPTPSDAAPILRFRTLQVTVINTPLFGGRWQVPVPAASFSDRLLDIIVIEEKPIGDLNKGLANFFDPHGPILAQPTKIHPPHSTRHSAELTGIPGIHHFQARGLTITTSADPQDATLDGEVQLQTPLHIQVGQEPLHVMVPAITTGHSVRLMGI
jgi:diacylglycerol kinase family enzyme